MDVKICKSQIEKNSGIIYDPKIISCVLENWEMVLKSREDESNKCMEEKK